MKTGHGPSAWRRPRACAWLAAVGLWLGGTALCSTVPGIELILSTPRPQLSEGDPLQLDLTILNGAGETLSIELPQSLQVNFETAAGVRALQLEATRSGRIDIASRGFVRVQLQGRVPREAAGLAKLVPANLPANTVVLQVQSAAGGQPQVIQPQNRAESVDAVAEAQSWRTALVDKPPPLAVSVYEPMYFLLGGDGGLNAKFQISFRYQLFDGRGPLARRLSWIDDLYLSFSQTSLWDLSELSKPFTDSSYRPRLFYADHDLARFFDGRLRLGLEAGAGHESNGKEGEDSRSFNMLYVRPNLILGDPQGLRFYLAPLIHNYIQEDENPDLHEYRGYVDVLLGAGSQGGLDFWTVLRKGTRGEFGSIEANVSYPLSKLSGGDLTGWLLLQYFGGWGESLVDYRRKLDAQLRLGVAVAL